MSAAYCHRTAHLFFVNSEAKPANDVGNYYLICVSYEVLTRSC